MRLTCVPEVDGYPEREGAPVGNLARICDFQIFSGTPQQRRCALTFEAFCATFSAVANSHPNSFIHRRETEASHACARERSPKRCPQMRHRGSAIHARIRWVPTFLNRGALCIPRRRRRVSSTDLFLHTERLRESREGQRGESKVSLGLCGSCVSWCLLLLSP